VEFQESESVHSFQKQWGLDDGKWDKTRRAWALDYQDQINKINEKIFGKVRTVATQQYLTL
jgi:hypothetical protein